MENTQVFLVIVATIILIIIAENQKLRNITWILLLGCITYIVLSIESKMEQRVENALNDLSKLETVQVITDQSSESNLDSSATNNLIEPIVGGRNIIAYPGTAITSKNLKVLKIAVAHNIEDRSPVGERNLFLSDVENIFCLTAVSNVHETNQLIHTWIYNNNEYLKTNIRIGKSPYWRCWSKITVRPELIGKWQVIATDTIGNILGSTKFAVIPAND